MKNNIRSKRIIGILLIALLIITTNVYAANDSFETTFTANKTQAKAEDTIVVTIGLSNIAIESGEKGIGGYTGSIKFDSSIFEYVSTSGTNKWETPFYENGLITATTKDGQVINNAQNVGTITFKVKKDAKVGETTIGLEKFSGTTGESDVDASNKSIKVTIVDDGNNTGNNNGNSNSSGNNSNSGNSSNNSSKPVNNSNGNNSQNTSTNKSDKLNIKKGVLPKAGNSNVVIFIAIGVCILLAIVLYVRFKKTDKKIND